jgi:hypothetical protein
MIWTNSDVLALASLNCARCDGLGFTRTADLTSTGNPCRCVLREIFKNCLKRFRDCVERPKHMSNTSLTRTSGPSGGRQVWGRKTEEFIADFICIAKRALGPGTFEYTLFRYIYLLGADEKLCCRQMRLDRETFFNARERIIQKLGRAYRETEPFSLYPIDEYFSSRIQGRSGIAPASLPPVERFRPLRAPLMKLPEAA